MSPKFGVSIGQECTLSDWIVAINRMIPKPAAKTGFAAENRLVAEHAMQRRMLASLSTSLYMIKSERNLITHLGYYTDPVFITYCFFCTEYACINIHMCIHEILYIAYIYRLYIT